MTRVIIVGDIHITETPPSTCTDSYLDDIFDMLRYIGRLSHALEVDATIAAGDIFHHKQPSRTSHRTVMQSIEVFRTWRNGRCTIGNHDIRNDRVDSITDTQPFGVVLHSGALRLLDGWDSELPLFGVQWQQRWTDPGTAWTAFEQYRSMDGLASGHPATVPQQPVLVVTHAPIYRPGFELEFEYVPTKGEHGISRAMDGRGFLYYGHIHEPHGIFEVEGVTYCNHGAISRGSLHEYNLTRDIAVTVWTDEPFEYSGFQFPVGFTKVGIPHKPASEVFKIAEAQERKSSELSLHDFLSSVSGTKIEMTSIESTIEYVRTRTDIDESVRKAAVQLLQEQA